MHTSYLNTLQEGEIEVLVMSELRTILHNFREIPKAEIGDRLRGMYEIIKNGK
jgi:hypothetical protein